MQLNAGIVTPMLHNIALETASVMIKVNNYTFCSFK